MTCKFTDVLPTLLAQHDYSAYLSSVQRALQTFIIQ